MRHSSLRSYFQMLDPWPAYVEPSCDDTSPHGRAEFRLGENNFN
jgi:hypothetical protein